MLATATLDDTTETLIYTCPASTRAVVSVNLVSRSAATTVRLAVVNNATPSNQHYLEYDASVPAAGILERSGLVLAAADRIYAKTSVAGVSVNVWGIEEAV